MKTRSLRKNQKMSFNDFRENLSTQMMNYDPRHIKYKGHMFMRKSTKQLGKLLLCIFMVSFIVSFSFSGNSNK